MEVALVFLIGSHEHVTAVPLILLGRRDKFTLGSHVILYVRRVLNRHLATSLNSISVVTGNNLPCNLSYPPVYTLLHGSRCSYAASVINNLIARPEPLANDSGRHSVSLFPTRSVLFVCYSEYLLVMFGFGFRIHNLEITWNRVS